MEATTTACSQTDIVCIAGELLKRWETLADDSAQKEAEACACRDCLPCVLADWDPAVDDVD